MRRPLHHRHHRSIATRHDVRYGIFGDTFLDAMNTLRIGTGVHYLAIPEHPHYQQRYSWKPEQWPNATNMGRHTVSLPLSPKLTDVNVDRVIDAVSSVALSHR